MQLDKIMVYTCSPTSCALQKLADPPEGRVPSPPSCFSSFAAPALRPRRFGRYPSLCAALRVALLLLRRATLCAARSRDCVPCASYRA